jgi:hypothetical protein
MTILLRLTVRVRIVGNTAKEYTICWAHFSSLVPVAEIVLRKNLHGRKPAPVIIESSKNQ